MDKLPLCNDKNVKKICNILKNANKECHVVGGAPRDQLMGKPPSDIDYTTNATPDEVIDIFKKARCGVKVGTGIKHGTVMVFCDKSGEKADITTYRKEGKYVDGRRPEEVEFVKTLQEDLSRRDFTANSIAINPLTCEIIDPFGGQEDIKRKILRTVGNPVDRFVEDGIRLLRAARFSARLGFVIDKETETAMKNDASYATFDKVPLETITDEIRKGLSSNNPKDFIDILSRTNLLWRIIPEMKEMKGMPQPTEHHEHDVWGHSLTSAESIIPCKYKKEIEEFLRSSQRNAWLEFDDVKVYVRKSKRLIEDKFVDALDMSNIDVPEHLWGRGIYTLVSSAMEQVARENGLYIYTENVLDEKLKKSLERDNKYKRLFPPGGNDISPPSYYKKPEDIERKVCVIPDELAFMRWMALVHDIGKPESYNNDPINPHFIGHDKNGAILIEKIMRRMKGWNAKEIDVAKNLIKNHLVFYSKDWTDAQVRRWINKIGPENVQKQIDLARADLIGHGDRKLEEITYYKHLEDRLAKTKEKGLAIKDLQLTGNDVMEIMGIPRGKEVGNILRAVLERVIDNPSLNTKEQLVELLKEMKK